MVDMATGMQNEIFQNEATTLGHRVGQRPGHITGHAPGMLHEVLSPGLPITIRSLAQVSKRRVLAI